ncbi:hypothetical protein L6452_04954 [Arctium lappa]|uniref:Uncharacterized protein n=1 Tax=Arctium lappa TaxID=4217 RepID=A0ACB9EF23_ARCLA|nr:hypothetical protein L6452_04954 [Arctium lappa]
MQCLPIYTNLVPDSLIAFSFALKNVTRSNFELSVAKFKINRDENEDGDLDTDHYKVNPRDFFIPTQENWLLVTADYSHIELRLMAHFSKTIQVVSRQPQHLQCKGCQLMGVDGVIVEADGPFL